MTRTLPGCLLIGLTMLACVAPAAERSRKPQASFSENRIHFARGAHGATLRGRVSRDKALLYTIGARAGQSMTVRLEGDAKTRFDLSGRKDRNGQAMASGETEWTGTLPRDGDYRIFVFTEDPVVAPFRLSVTVK
jgi:hypothetical protein